MAHSVSDKLIIQATGRGYCVASVHKDGILYAFSGPGEASTSSLADLIDSLPDIFSSVIYLMEGTPFIMVPEDHFQTDLDSIYALSYSKGNNETLFLDQMEMHAGIVYPMEDDTVTAIRRKFPVTTVKHAMSVIIPWIYGIQKGRSSKIFLLPGEGHLTIVVKGKHGVLLANRYSVSNQEEILYYTMLAVELLELVQEETDLYVLDTDGRYSGLKELFRPFFPEVIVETMPVQFAGNLRVEQIRDLQFAARLLVCGL